MVGGRIIFQNRITMVGRDPELAWLAEDLEQVVAGHGRLVVLEGEAGIGKTSLVAASLDIALDTGFTVFRGSGFELARDRPFGVIAETLGIRSTSEDPERAAVAGLLRGPAAGYGHLEFRLLEDILLLVERAAMSQPVALAVDDLQYADSPSLLALAHLSRHCPSLPVALVVARRPGRARPEVDRCVDSMIELGGRWLQLGPLSTTAVSSLVGQHVIGTPGESLLRELARAGGNPLLITEFIEAARHEQTLSVTGDGTVELVGRALPLSFRRLVLRRLATMPAATSEALKLASVLGSDFTVTDLATGFGRQPSELAATLGPALDEGLIVEAGERLGFRHQLVRDVIYEQIPRSLRSALHGQVGHVLAVRGEDAVQVATHLSMAGHGGADEAVAWLRRAAGEAAPRSPGSSVELLDRALTLAGPAHAQHNEMLADRAIALAWSGQAAESVAAARGLLAANLGGPLDARLRGALAQALLLQGRWAESVEHFRVLAARSDVSEGERARLLGDAALGLAHMGALEQAVAFADEARAVGERLGDKLTQSIALSSLAVAAHFEARYLDTLDLAQRARTLALQSRNSESVLRPTEVWLGLALADADRFPEALAVLHIGLDRCEDAGMNWQLPLYHDAIGTISFYAGEWDDAMAEMESCIALAEESGTRWWIVPARTTMTFVGLHRDQFDEALRDLADAGGSGRNDALDEFGGNRRLWVTGLVSEARGEVAAALSLIGAGWEATAQAGFLPHHLVMGVDYVKLSMAAGELDRARASADLVESIAARTGVGSAQATGLRCQGLARSDPAALLEAVALLRMSPRRVDLAFACEEAAVCLADSARSEEAIGLLDEALAEYRRVGARRDAVRALATLRRLGARRGAGGSSARPALGWASLTPTESRVVGLASQGLTNPEIGSRLFISRRTVATHLSHIFGKLQISSRVELAAMTRDRPGPPGSTPRSGQISVS